MLLHEHPIHTLSAPVPGLATGEKAAAKSARKLGCFFFTGSR